MYGLIYKYSNKLYQIKRYNSFSKTWKCKIKDFRIKFVKRESIQIINKANVFFSRTTMRKYECKVRNLEQSFNSIPECLTSALFIHRAIESKIHQCATSLNLSLRSPPHYSHSRCAIRRRTNSQIAALGESCRRKCSIMIVHNQISSMSSVARWNNCEIFAQREHIAQETIFLCKLPCNIICTYVCMYKAINTSTHEFMHITEYTCLNIYIFSYMPRYAPKIICQNINELVCA